MTHFGGDQVGYRAYFEKIGPLPEYGNVLKIL